MQVDVRTLAASGMFQGKTYESNLRYIYPLCPLQIKQGLRNFFSSHRERTHNFLLDWLLILSPAEYPSY